MYVHIYNINIFYIYVVCSELEGLVDSGTDSPHLFAYLPDLHHNEEDHVMMDIRNINALIFSYL